MVCRPITSRRRPSRILSRSIRARRRMLSRATGASSSGLRIAEGVDAIAPAPGRVIRVGRQSIIADDCLAALARLEPESFDVCVTSPPYNIGIAYRSYRDRLPREVYLAWLGEVGAAIAK